MPDGKYIPNKTREQSVGRSPSGEKNRPLAKPGLMVIALPESHVGSGTLATVYGMLKVSARREGIVSSSTALKQGLS